MAQGVIETGVDKLLSVVKEKKSISLKDAAKALGVSEPITEEWASFLEDEGYISKEYKLTKLYLVVKEVSSVQIEAKAEQIDSTRDAVSNKAEVAIARLNQDSEVIGSLRKEFDLLKDDIATELKGMQIEIDELERYESLKDDIDKKLQSQEKEFKKRFDAIDNEILKEQDKYSELVSKIDAEKEKLEKERAESLTLKEKENSLHKQLNDLFDKLKTVDKEASTADDNIARSEQVLEKLESLSTEFQDQLKEKQSEIGELVQANKDYEAQVVKAREDLLAKIKTHQGKLEKSAKKSNPEDKFKTFFTKKKDIEKLLDDLDKEKVFLEKDLLELIKKAKAFKVASKGKDMQKQVAALEKHMKETEKKRKSYDDKLHKLSSLIGGPKTGKKKGLFGF